MRKSLIFGITIMVVALTVTLNQCTGIKKYEIVKNESGISFISNNGSLMIGILSPEIVRLRISPNSKFSDKKSLVTKDLNFSAKWDFIEKSNHFIVSTDKMKILVDKKYLSVKYLDNSGHEILNEAIVPRKFYPGTINGDSVFH
ncbi:MAG: DUF4968 domain-containing protein, partial [Bacteroidales bacterium]|nr:DUF4968 domain-containing protein [Bacteroidales bacterium]